MALVLPATVWSIISSVSSWSSGLTASWKSTASFRMVPRRRDVCQMGSICSVTAQTNPG
ncbi:Uncharacterised protein [Mycobacteroides abscessus subsp. abscessus]|nr:Uncharacterised protein [Mycobacteroides abscessus subsp. abscessus]